MEHTTVDRHIMDCCPAGREQEVFKCPDRAESRWLSKLCDEAGTHLRTETLSRLTSNTSAPHAADDTETARVLGDIFSGHPDRPQFEREQAPKKPRAVERTSPPPWIRRVFRGIHRTRERALTHRNQLHPILWGTGRVRDPGVGFPANFPNQLAQARSDMTHGEEAGGPAPPWSSKPSPSARRTPWWQTSPRRNLAALTDPTPSPWGGGNPCGTGWK